MLESAQNGWLFLLFKVDTHVFLTCGLSGLGGSL